MTDIDLGQARQAARPLRILARFFRRSWQALVVVVLAIALAVAAYLSPGLVQADVRLDEGTVYAANRELNLLGTVNAQIDELAAATNAGDSRFRLFQHEEQVHAFLPQSWNLHPYRPGRNILDQATKIPTNGVVQEVGGKMLVYDQENGRVWHGTIDEMLEVDFHRDKADLEVGEFGVATLTTTGNVIGLNPNDSTLVRMEGETVVTKPVPITFDPEKRSFEISAVGDTAVVLDRDQAQVWVEGLPKAFTINWQSQAMLLPPVDDVLRGAEKSRGLVVTRAGMLGISSEGFKSLSGKIDMNPVRPVQVGDCLYGAFANGPGEGVLVKRCVGEEPVVTQLEHLASDGSELEFQVNRTTVALNDMSNGTVWLVNRGTVILPEDWESVRPINERKDAEVTEGDPTVQPDRTRENRPPVARDDDLGARAGQSTILPVLDNDTDPDGDLLRISVNQTEIEHATLQLVRAGAGLQITVNADVAPGTVIPVPYTIDDGNGATASATAMVRVYPQDATAANQPPRPRGQGVDAATIPPPQPLRVTLGDADVTFRALLDWRDPEGDPLLLRRAYMDPQWDDIVRFTPDGEITYTDIGKTAGDKIIHLVVEDAHGAEKEGQVTVSVSEEVLPPTVFGDFVTTLQGETVTVEPLLNDIRARNLTEVSSEDCPGCIETQLADNRFTFTADQEGTYYVDYSVNNGGVGLVRIDVLPRLANRPPVPVLDVAHVPAMGSATIDPLLNDTDPDNDVLVIQTVTNVPDDLNVTMERRTLLTIEATRELTERRVIKYMVSDGRESREGTILVIPTPRSDEIGPRVEDDTLRVRAGATGSVNVLDNDSSPDGRELTLHPELIDNPFGDNAWVEGDSVRVAVPAGAAPGLSQIRYRVADQTGEARDGLVRVTVVSEEASNADPPQPRQVIDRMLAGTTTRIPIPLDGIDPQGDAVRLVGLGSIPELGRVMAVGERYIEYEAFLDSAGTDTFEYVVVDTHGQRATGEIRIGIAKPSTTNNAPIAVLDEITVRPGRTAQVDPLVNDYDLDGDPIMFASDEPARMEDDIPVTLVDNRELVMVAPMEEGVYTGTYDIVDQRGEVSSGAITMRVAADAPLLPPVTRDDLIDASQLGSSPFVVAEPLLNDYDPDGPRDELSVVIPDEDPDDELAPRVTAPGEVTVGVRDTMQQVRYIAVDGDGLETNGVITIPGRGDVVPTLKNPGQEMTVTAGEELLIDINTMVQGTRGREVELSNTTDIIGLRGHANAAGADTVAYVPDRTYFGPSVVVFKVQDIMQDSDAEEAPEAFISIPVDVKRAPIRGGVDETDPDNPIYMVNEPPVPLTDNPVLKVGAGEDPVSIDVSKLFRAQGGGSVSLFGRPVEGAGDAPIDWEYRGNTIIARALETARKGQTLQIHGEVIDGSVDGNTAKFTLTVLVVASSFPTVTVGKEITAVVNAGSSVTVPVTLGAVSHLRVNKEVRLEGARVVSGNGSVDIDRASGSVKVHADAGWNGLLVIAYALNDALEDPDRRVEGRLTVKVTDIPPRPEAPYGVITGDGMATVRYTSNGTGGDTMVTTEGWAYIGGNRAVQGDCAGGRCVFNGLTNGQAYTVRVADSNSVGTSPESADSAPFIPDVKLLAPQTPTVDFDNQALKISWTHNPMWDSPRGSTSHVASYVVSRWRGTSLVDQRTVAGNVFALRWDGLANGDPYSFSVKALSSHTGPQAANYHSDDSPRSQVEHATGPPLGAVSVSPTTIQSDIGGGFRVSVNTAGINGNGDSIRAYRVVPYTASGEHTDKQKVFTVGAGGAGTFEVEIYGMGTSATRFNVYPQNRYTDTYGGEKALGSSDRWLTSWARPKVTSLSLTRGDGSIAISAAHNMPEGSPGVLQYSLGDGWAELPFNGRYTASGLTNGQSYTVSVRAVLDGMESAHASDTAMPRSANPLAPSLTSVLLNGESLTSVVATVGQMGLVETGGWDPSAYEFCGSDGNNCKGRFQSGRTVAVPVSGGNVLWRVQGADGGGGALPVEPTTAELPRRTGEAHVNFRLGRVESGECVFDLHQHNRNRVTDTYGPVSASNGTLSFNGDLYITPDPVMITPPPTEEDPSPTPMPSQPPRITPKHIVMRCVINGARYSQEINY